MIAPAQQQGFNVCCRNLLSLWCAMVSSQIILEICARVCLFTCRAVLLAGPQPRVVLGPSCASWLLEHFRDVDTSASMAQRAMQVGLASSQRGVSQATCLRACTSYALQLHGCLGRIGRWHHRQSRCILVNFQRSPSPVVHIIFAGLN